MNAEEDALNALVSLNFLFSPFNMTAVLLGRHTVKCCSSIWEFSRFWYQRSAVLHIGHAGSSLISFALLWNRILYPTSSSLQPPPLMSLRLLKEVNHLEGPATQSQDDSPLQACCGTGHSSWAPFGTEECARRIVQLGLSQTRLEGMCLCSHPDMGTKGQEETRAAVCYSLM